MLFYSQIKREFTAASWKRGQIYFREQRINDVKLEGDKVTGRIHGQGEAPYQTMITMARGTISSSKCNCPAHRVYETHCKHVAALAIWVVERGSILRAGIEGAEYGVAPSENELVFRDAQKAAADPRLQKLMVMHSELVGTRFVIRRERMSGTITGKDLRGISFSIPITLFEAAALLEYTEKATAVQGLVRMGSGLNNIAKHALKPVKGEPILYVKGLFSGKIFTGLMVESGVRYRDSSGILQLNTLSYLTKMPEPALWKTRQEILIRVPLLSEIPDAALNFIHKIDTPKTLYEGQDALENLGRLLEHKHRDQMVFDRAIDMKIEPAPLKLASLNIGSKIADEERALSFEFEGEGGVKFGSQELADLARQGRLSAQYLWSGDKIYKFQTSFARLLQFTSKNGQFSADSKNVGEEGEEGSSKSKSPQLNGFGLLHDGRENPLHPIAAYRLSLELGVTNFVVDENWTEFHEWKKQFDKKRIPTLPQTEYGFDLRPYQENGLSWMWSLYHRGLAALLADDMGLGKTHQVLAFLSCLYRHKKSRPSEPSLVVAPTSVVAAWIQKLNKYDTGLRWHVFHGAGRTLPDKNVDLVLTTYGILHREPALREREWHVAMLDEAQAIKNASTISSRASRALKAKYRIAMTGTPVENQATDLWSIMEFLLPGYLGSLTRFKRLYGFGRTQMSDVEAQALKRLVSPFLLRRTKSTVLKELPEKIEEVMLCKLTEAQKQSYRMYLESEDAKRARDNLSSTGKIDYANILAVLTRLKQVCDHPKLIPLTAGDITDLDTIEMLHSGKWETFTQLMEQALGSELKVVVFTQYLGMIDLICNYLKKQGVGYVDLRGDTQDRGARLEKFSSDPNCRVFVCSLLAGGLGIDLTAASVCIHYDRWWNPAKENQATDRLHRYGQTRGVQVFKLQISGTVEDRIASIIQSKMDLSGALIEESSAGLKAFSRQDLLKLLDPSNDILNQEEEIDVSEIDDTPEMTVHI